MFGLKGESVRESVRASVWESVGASVWESVRESVWASVRASVRASVGESVWASVRASVRASVYGQHEASWLGFYDYFVLACGLSEETQRLSGLWEVAQSAGWWLPHREVCWVSERPCVLSRDGRGRLHCEDAPALAYPDGWCIYAIGGVRVPEPVVMTPDLQSIDQIKGEQNAEVKRLRIERYAGIGSEPSAGWRRYLEAVGAEVVDRRRNDVEGTREVLMRAADQTVLVCHCPSTGRVYAMEVPADVATAEQAQRWLWSGSRTAELVRRPVLMTGRT